MKKVICENRNRDVIGYISLNENGSIFSKDKSKIEKYVDEHDGNINEVEGDWRVQCAIDCLVNKRVV